MLYPYPLLDKANSGVLGTGEIALFQGNGEQRPNFEGNNDNTYREHKKTNFPYMGSKPIYFKGLREQIPHPGGHLNSIQEIDLTCLRHKTSTQKYLRGQSN